MGCFLACFGSTKDRRRRRQRHKVQPRDQRNASYAPALESAVSLVHDESLEPISSVSEISGKPEDHVGLNIRRKVTFDSNVKTFEHVSLGESVDFALDKEDGVKREEKEENLVKPTQSQSSSEDSSITSSGSYPPNHRYQNCRDSDDELDYLESDIEDEDDDDDIEEMDEDGDGLDYDDDNVVESRPRMPVDKVVTEEIDSSVVIRSLPERELKSSNNARDRSNYVHPVLNPVENLTQWKAVKAKGTPQLRQQKQNVGLDQESRIFSGSDLSFEEISFSFKPKSEQSRKLNQVIAVDASLSNWLGSSESTPINKPSATGLDTTASEKSTSQGSNSPRNFEDRPILGALTIEEIKQLSPSSSPRRSPSPDEMPIIGTVGTYWNHNDSVQASGSASSYKGIPNTTSKYREDKKVNWHSTPFEKRLERALNGGSPGVYTTGHTSNVC
uniref:Uncharacterized protein n=1 Tax=Rhizophora mucronata TaxID=61149 RepID=A0A2P2NZH6_RHIMU